MDSFVRIKLLSEPQARNSEPLVVFSRSALTRFLLSSEKKSRGAWLVNSRALATKVKNAGLLSAYQMKDCGAKRQCPNCGYLIDNSDVSDDWPGLPAGVKFDPSDIELLEHLAAKCRIGDLKPHIFIDEFIPTLEGDDGICYTHPENLPGAKKDGSSVHYFYRIANAYASGHRKRRRIQDQGSMINVPVRWHKTGKTKPVMENGVQKGFKKIMVLYANSKRGSKPDKCNWVMHQYHLGMDEDEKEGEYVVSKVFYQLKETDKNESSLASEEADMGTIQIIPRTPMTVTPDPPRQEKTPSSAGSSDDYFIWPLEQEAKHLNVLPYNPSTSVSKSKDEMVERATKLAGGSKAIDQSDSLLCKEIMSSDHNSPDQKPNIAASFGDLNNIELDSPPDFQLTDLDFASQDSVFDWLDRI